jgi:hypothetical protein
MMQYEMNPIKRLQMLYSWSEFYFANKREKAYYAVNQEINALKEEITRRNTIYKARRAQNKK